MHKKRYVYTIFIFFTVFVNAIEENKNLAKDFLVPFRGQEDPNKRSVRDYIFHNSVGKKFTRISAILGGTLCVAFGLKYYIENISKYKNYLNFSYLKLGSEIDIHRGLLYKATQIAIPLLGLSLGINNIIQIKEKIKYQKNIDILHRIKTRSASARNEKKEKANNLFQYLNKDIPLDDKLYFNDLWDYCYLLIIGFIGEWLIKIYEKTNYPQQLHDSGQFLMGYSELKSYLSNNAKKINEQYNLCFKAKDNIIENLRNSKEHCDKNYYNKIINIKENDFKTILSKNHKTIIFLLFLLVVLYGARVSTKKIEEYGINKESSLINTLTKIGRSIPFLSPLTQKINYLIIENTGVIYQGLEAYPFIFVTLLPLSIQQILITQYSIKKNKEMLLVLGELFPIPESLNSDKRHSTYADALKNIWGIDVSK
jgi:hypothetical protein